MKKDAKIRGIVYSTEHGTLCPDCGEPIAACLCKQTRAIPQGDGFVRVRLETKGRKGKGVTIITGIPLDPAGQLTLARTLKQKCSTGGTVKDGVIEIQGDRRDVVIEELQKQGFRTRRIGG